MSEPREMRLGERAFQVPPLPIGINMAAYPLLRKLNNNGFTERWVEGGPTEADMTDLSAVAFLCAKAADPALTAEAFQALPVRPAQMFAAYFLARFQSGGWVEAAADAPEGEDGGEAKPPTSTSPPSSPS